MFHSKTRSTMTARRGASAIIVVNLFVVMILFAFFAINMANIQRHQSASQIASDLGSRWGVDLVSRGVAPATVERQVRELTQRNWTVSQNIDRNWLRDNRQNIDVEVEVGSARPTEDGRFEFFANQLPYNAVRVDSSSFTSVVGFAAPRGRENPALGINRVATAMALERDVCLVIDRSGSMTFDLDTGGWMYNYDWHEYNAMANSSSRSIRNIGYSWWWYWPHPTDSRWSTMIPAVYGLADELELTTQDEILSIVSYSTDYSRTIYDHNASPRTYYMDASEVEVAPSGNYTQAAQTFENKYKWNKPVMGGTNISAGIDEAAAVLTGSDARPNAFKTMIVMTDGQANSGRDPVLAAEDAAAMGIEVYTVTFSQHADTLKMLDVADAGNGRHFHAPDGDALEEVFRAIANIPPAAYIE